MNPFEDLPLKDQLANVAVRPAHQTRPMHKDTISGLKALGALLLLAICAGISLLTYGSTSAFVTWLLFMGLTGWFLRRVSKILSANMFLATVSGLLFWRMDAVNGYEALLSMHPGYMRSMDSPSGNCTAHIFDEGVYSPDPYYGIRFAHGRQFPGAFRPIPTFRNNFIDYWEGTKFIIEVEDPRKTVVYDETTRILKERVPATPNVNFHP